MADQKRQKIMTQNELLLSKPRQILTINNNPKRIVLSNKTMLPMDDILLEKKLNKINEKKLYFAEKHKQKESNEISSNDETEEDESDNDEDVEDMMSILTTATSAKRLKNEDLETKKARKSLVKELKKMKKTNKKIVKNLYKDEELKQIKHMSHQQDINHAHVFKLNG